MSRSEKKHVNVYYSNDKSHNKYEKEISRKRARKQRKQSLKVAMMNKKEEEIYSLKNYHYDLFGVIEKGYCVSQKEVQRRIEEEVGEGCFDGSGVFNKPKRKAYLKFRIRK